MRRPLLILTTLLLLLGGSWLFKEHQRERTAVAPATENHIDYYFKGLSSVRMSEHGWPRESLRSEQLQHHSGDDIASLNAPQIWLRDEQGQQWRLRADHGEVYEQGARVELLGNVRLNRPAHDDIAPLRLSSEQMSLYPQRGYAESRAPVQISDAHATINALGMQAYIDEQRLELPAEVRGTYDPGTP